MAFGSTKKLLAEKDAEIAELKRLLKDARQHSQKYHRRMQALEGPWIAKVEGARAWAGYIQNAMFNRPELMTLARAFEAGQAVERESLLALIRSDHPFMQSMSQHWRDRIAAFIRSGGKTGIEPPPTPSAESASAARAALTTGENDD